MDKHDIKDIKLSGEGKKRIEWAGFHMPVLNLIRKDFSKSKPLKGIRVSACLHVTTETANLMIALKEAGAEVILCASNPLSTQDATASSLVADFNIPVFAKKGVDKGTYYEHINNTLDIKPHITMDDGADLVSVIHKERNDLTKDILGGTEETTTGVIRLRALAKEKKLLYPIIAVNDAKTKHFFDNRYGTGQSTIDGLLRATNILLAGTRVVVCGYGWCGRGIAMRAQGMGAIVSVVEVDPFKALEAVMDGFEVLTMTEAAKKGKVFITSTGDIHVIRKEHFLQMQDGAIIANSGHFNVELDIDGLKESSKSVNKIRDSIQEFVLNNGNRVYLLSEGRLLNLSAAEGHPSSVMDMSFANQALSVLFIKENNTKLGKDVYVVDEDIDKRVALLKLKSMNIEIDVLTDEQKKYLDSWQLGT